MIVSSHACINEVAERQEGGAYRNSCGLTRSRGDILVNVRVMQILHVVVHETSDEYSFKLHEIREGRRR